MREFKFKIGDRVIIKKVIDPSLLDNPEEYYIGQKGTVSKIETGYREPYPYKVDFDNKDLKDVYWDEEELDYEESNTENPINTSHIKINDTIKTKRKYGLDTNLISDGFHTFGELYEHRITLYLSLLSYMKDDPSFKVWYSHKHSDGVQWDGWIIVGVVNKWTDEQISYHIGIEYEQYLKNLTIEELELGLEWDGHTSDDVLNTLKEWLLLI